MKNNKKLTNYLYFFENTIPLLVEIAQNYKKQPNNEFNKGKLDGIVDVFEVIKLKTKHHNIDFEFTDFETFNITSFYTKFEQHTTDDLDKYKNCISEIIETLLERTSQRKQQTYNLYNDGFLFAYYDVISFTQQQAELAFQIPLKELKLENVNLEEFAFAV